MVKPKGQTNQLWRAHVMAKESLDEVKRIGAYFSSMDPEVRATKLAPHDADVLLDELRRAYRAMEPVSQELTRIYHKYGGTI